MSFTPGWRSHLLERIRPQEGLTDLYEFGVFTGRSMMEIAETMDRIGIEYSNFFGFDSFEGIPKWEGGDTYNPEWDPDNPVSYCKGFNAVVELGSADKYEAMIEVSRRIQAYIPARSRTVMVPGFFSDSLTDSIGERCRELGQALYVDIDVDIYSSAKEALMRLFKHQIATVGTYIGYDDWGGTPGYMSLLDGESRAHREVSEEYGVYFALIGGVGGDKPSSQVVFQVTGID